MKYRRRVGYSKLMAELVLRSGGYLVILGLSLVISYGIYLSDLPEP